MKKLILILSLLFTSISYAKDFKAYEFHVQELPAVCGTQKEVEKYADDNDYIVLNYSLGRAGSEPTGEPVFGITYWVNKEVSQTMATVVVPNSDQACILYVSFDVIHNEKELKKGKPTQWQKEHY